MNQLLEKLKVKQHPRKTFIGRISRGFDFLGYRFSPSGLGIAQPTLTRFLERAGRLYEQGADAIRIDEYVRRWWKWVRGGLGKFSALVKAESAFDCCILCLATIGVLVPIFIPLEKTLRRRIAYQGIFVLI